MKGWREEIYFNRSKEDNWEIEENAKRLGWKDSKELLYLGCEVRMEVGIREDGANKILKINGIDVSDKNITI
ncbi:MAG: hypothetical protein AB2417_02760 [Clostridiaceae bacterium]